MAGLYGPNNRSAYTIGWLMTECFPTLSESESHSVIADSLPSLGLY